MMNIKMVDVAKEYIGLNINNEHTARGYIGAARSFDSLVAYESIADLDTAHLVQWKQKLLASARQNTFVSYLGHLRVLGNYAVRKEMMRANVFLELKGPKGERLPKTIPAADYHEGIALLKQDKLPPSWFWLIVMEVILSTAMRSKQAVELCWDDIDFRNKILYYKWRGSKTNVEWQIPLTDYVGNLLNELKDQTELVQDIRPTDQVFNVTLFNDKYVGKRMKSMQLHGFFRRLSDQLSGGRITCHRLRHTRATQLGCVPDANLFALQQLLGHTDIRMTREYVAVDTDSVRRLLESADKERESSNYA